MARGRLLLTLLRHVLALLCLCAAGLASASVAPLGAALISVGMPEGFAGLAETQHVVADFTFGGRPIGQFEVEFEPGRLRIIDPGAVAAAIPGIADAATVRAALANPALDTNARYVCDAGPACDRPSPDVAAIVFDPRRFRVALYINPRFLSVRPVTTEHFLSADRGGWSLVDQVGAAIAGGEGQPPVYDLRNRVILARGDARLVSEASVSSGSGASVDTLAVQVDRPDMRYSAGAFYVPGIDLTGRRRIVGAGVTSQYDTRTDRDLITGTPLVVFLGQRSRVDLVVEGRLMSSHSYEAGNQTLDTSSLPDGSYAVEIHIQEGGGAERVERRFFTKSALIPPAGKTLFFADAGVLAFDRPHSLIAVSRDPIAEIGVARRVGAHMAYDATLLGTRDRAILEVGASVMTKRVQGRIAILGSSAGDYGVIAQANSNSTARFGYNFDLRRISTHDGKPLLPLDDVNVNPFGVSASQQGAALTAATYSQAVANVSYRLAQAQIGVSAYYRRDQGRPASYAIGPVVHWSILQRNRVQLGFDGSLAQTERGRSVALGLRFQLLGKRSAVGASLGAQTGTPGDDRKIGAVAEVNGSVQRSNVLGGDFAGSGSVQQGAGGTLLQGNVEERGPAGYGTATLVHRADGAQTSTQYSLGFQTSFAAGRHVVTLGARQQNDAVIAVSLHGDTKGGKFEVLVDDAPQGRIGAGDRLTISVQPYRRYTVRIRPIGGDLVAFDTAPRVVDAFPGTVAGLGWKVSPQLAMFGRLLHVDGTPVANADIRTGTEIAATDDRGWFQLQAARDATIEVREAGGRTCRATLDGKATNAGYSALGTVTCRP